MIELWKLFWFLRFIKSHLSGLSYPWSDAAMVSGYFTKGDKKHSTKNTHPDTKDLFRMAEDNDFITYYANGEGGARLYKLTPKGRKFVSFPIGTLTIVGKEIGTGISLFISGAIIVWTQWEHILRLLHIK